PSSVAWKPSADVRFGGELRFYVHSRMMEGKETILAQTRQRLSGGLPSRLATVFGPVKPSDFAPNGPSVLTDREHLREASASSVTHALPYPFIRMSMLASHQADNEGIQTANFFRHFLTRRWN